MFFQTSKSRENGAQRDSKVDKIDSKINACKSTKKGENYTAKHSTDDDDDDDDYTAAAR